jgi:hypothetical protein
MGGLQKEHILSLLRDYHTGEYPVVSPSELFDELKAELSLLEDDVIGAVLSTVNGKAILANYFDQLDEFLNKVVATTATEPTSAKIQEYFTLKINHLREILNLAAKGDFPLRKQRPARVSLATKTIVVKK